MTDNLRLIAETESVQRAVSDPRVSAFVTANAGSGKTHVLAQRVLRLLLDGAPPSKILCLTFTRAAAANMSARIFDALAKWTGLDDAALRAEIIKTGHANADAAALRLARVLFARTVETPGGLKIQTIHAFCTRVLHLFPFEANVPAAFEQAEGAQQSALLARARGALLAAAAGDADLGGHIAALAGVASWSKFDQLLAQAPKFRALIIGALRDYERPAARRAALCERLGLPRGASLEGLWREIVDGGAPRATWPAFAKRLARGGADEKEAAARLESSARGGSLEAAAGDYLSVYLTKNGTPRKNLPTRALATADPGIVALLESESRRVTALHDQLSGVRILERSLPLSFVFENYLGQYERLKQRAGLLDFDDIVTRTLSLLQRSDAAWVLYKLDAGVDHILVDEAQDTSPAQWQILTQIAADFSAGAGARAMVRSVFAVGDVKQSIYSFQGAEPREFSAMQAHFDKRFTNARQRFLAPQLQNSFRSAAAILETVDRVFADPRAHRGLSADDSVAPVHQNIRLGLPGLVELWPALLKPEAEATASWRLPADLAASADPAVQVASRVVGLINSWLAPGSTERVADKQTGQPRRIAPGDVMILFSRRSAVYRAVIRACKQAGVPVSGADRLRILEHIAVEDIIAAAQAALLPQDDLTLAAALKSPLVGLDEEELLWLAAGRAGSLYDALKAAAASAPRMAAAAAIVDGWRGGAAQTPFVFFSQLLGPGGARARLLARLGAEAEDALDEFLSFALAWQKRNAPSLGGFLAALRETDLEIKRDLEAAGGPVRVMTVHGAKGLEAKIVILPDACAMPAAGKEAGLFALGEPPLIAWSPKKDEDCAATAKARAAANAARDDEYRRLLYVAMTRAEERLYIAGVADKKGPHQDSWHAIVARAIEPVFANAPAHWDASETILRRADPWPAGVAQAVAPAAPPQEREAPPVWLRQPAAPEPPAPPPLRPSQALGAALAPDGEAAMPARRSALKRGALIHTLLQHLPPLPPHARPGAAARFLDQRAPELAADERAALAIEILGVLNLPLLAPLFGTNSRAEAAIAGGVTLRGGARREISGQIDRLAVSDSEIIIADFKTGAAPAAGAPAAYVAQLALYGAVLGEIYPGHTLRALIIWTAGPRVEEIAPAALVAALASHAMTGSVANVIASPP